ncbi:Protein AIM2 [Grifola frondosa]|uniref:Protein AIM2 n=1 Tax=Grifola frondosa TaxID=5627 RepID=A0A1C7LW66_GRIFR|nr:Protein AIM2 [Grifola frondosa]
MVSNCILHNGPTADNAEYERCSVAEFTMCPIGKNILRIKPLGFSLKIFTFNAQHCFTGVRHEGKAEGKIEFIGGIECYVATPADEYPKDKVVLFLTDVFGIPLINNRLLVDDFARCGYRTIMPDLFDGDAVPDVNLELLTAEFPAWLGKHGPDSLNTIVDKVVAALKDSGVTWIGTTSYCFGAPPALYLAFKNESHATAIAHPSRLQFPADLERYRDHFPGMLRPLPMRSSEEANSPPGYERKHWDGCTHGFAVRGDLSDPNVKAGKEGAFKTTVEFFNKYSKL